MRKLGVPKVYIDWLLVKLDGRTTALAFDDYESAQLPVLNGIDQGCPLSVIFYLLYNSDLVRVANNGEKELCIGYIDDITYLAWGKSFEETHAKLKDMMNRANGALDWSCSHHSDFELDKTACIDFATRKGISRPPLTIGAHTITPTRTHTLLGVCLDQELRWKDQGNKALAKGMTWVSQLSRLAKFAYGASPLRVRQLYLSIAVHRFTYAAEIWYSPVIPGNTTSKRGRGSIGLAKRLATVQNTAARAILGAMRSTPIDLLNAFAALLPITVRLNAICLCAAIRLASAPADHPLHKAVAKCARGRKKHAPPLQNILSLLDCKPTELEKWSTRPKSLTSREKRTFPDRKTARESSRTDDTPVQIFTDGTVGTDGAGAAAILLAGGIRGAEAGLRLKQASERSPLEAELAALHLAFHLIDLDPPIEEAVIYSDSQLAIRAVLGESVGAPPHLLGLVRKAYRQAVRITKGTGLRLDWCPAHAGVRGNEEADREAKAAARGKVYPPGRTPRTLAQYSPLRDPQLLKDQSYTTSVRLADDIWANSEAAFKLSRRCKSLDPRLFFGMIVGLNRSRATLLFRLISGHVALGAHLHRIGCSESDLCSYCGSEPETVSHFLFRCSAHGEDRHEHLGSRGRDFLSLDFLLSSPGGIQALLGFVKATRRFADSLR